MSFSGLGGTGGAGRLVEEAEGMERVRGASMRSGIGCLGIAACCGGGCCGYWLHWGSCAWPE